MESQFRFAVRSGLAKDVPMNGFAAVSFSSTTPSIGTDGLGGCSVVLIVSTQAAILGHVSPRPDDRNTSDPHAGDNHIKYFMDQLIIYYRQCRNLFPNKPDSFVVCAIFQDEIALPDQQRIMKEKLEAEGLKVDTSSTYVVPSTSRHADNGSVFVDGRGSTIQVYVENTLVKSIPRGSAQPSGTPASAATTYAPAESQWDGQNYVWTKNRAYIWMNGQWVLRQSASTSANPSQNRPIQPSTAQSSVQPNTAQPSTQPLSPQWALLRNGVLKIKPATSNSKSTGRLVEIEYKGRPFRLAEPKKYIFVRDTGYYEVSYDPAQLQPLGEIPLDCQIVCVSEEGYPVRMRSNGLWYQLDKKTNQWVRL